jgi:hypothetical protein
MSKKNDSPINQYLILGKLFEKDFEYDKVAEFVEQYLKIAQKKGDDGNEVLIRLKNFSMELNDAILTSCINLQGKLPSKEFADPTSDRVTIKDGARVYAITPATIRNWIKDPENPLPSINVGKRKTTISLKDLKNYMFKVGKSRNNSEAS